MWRLGDVASRLGMHDRALALVQSSLVHAPHDQHAWNCLGTVHIAAGRPQEAFKAFSHAVATAPDFIIAVSNLGKLYAQLGRLDEAVTAHRMCAIAEPGVAAHRVDLGNAFIALEDWGAALAAFRNGICGSIDPTHVEAQLGMGVALARRQDNVAAAEVFGRLVAAHPGLTAARRNLALALFGCGRIEDAVDAFRAALATAPGDAKTHANLIFALDLDPRARLRRGDGRTPPLERGARGLGTGGTARQRSRSRAAAACRLCLRRPEGAFRRRGVDAAHPRSFGGVRGRLLFRRCARPTP